MRLLLSVLFAVALLADPPSTVVQDTILKQDGARYTGLVVVAWPNFQAVDGSPVASGSRTVAVTSGVFRVALPAYNAYSVLFVGDGIEHKRQVWAVPASATPVRIADVVTAQSLPLDGQALVWDSKRGEFVAADVLSWPTSFFGSSSADVYSAGTAALAAGETEVLGSGTSWTSDLAGRWLVAENKAVRIATVEDAAHLTLADPWPGTNQATVSYTASRLVMVAGDVHRLRDLGFRTATYCHNAPDDPVEITPVAIWVKPDTHDVGLLFGQACKRLYLFFFPP